VAPIGQVGVFFPVGICQPCLHMVCSHLGGPWGLASLEMVDSFHDLILRWDIIGHIKGGNNYIDRWALWLLLGVELNALCCCLMQVLAGGSGGTATGLVVPGSEVAPAGTLEVPGCEVGLNGFAQIFCLVFPVSLDRLADLVRALVKISLTVLREATTKCHFLVY
jgi:hypothetical protein